MNNALYIFGLIKQAAPSGLGDDGYGAGADKDDERGGVPRIYNKNPNSIHNFWLDNEGRGFDLTPTPVRPDLQRTPGRVGGSGPPSGLPGHNAPPRLSPRLESIFGRDSYTRHGTGRAPHNGAMKTYIPSKGTYERVENHGTDDKGRKNLFSGTTPAAMRRRFARHSLTPVEPEYNDKGRYLGTPTSIGEKGGPTFMGNRSSITDPTGNVQEYADIVDPYWEEHKKNYIGLTHKPTGGGPRHYSGPTPTGGIAKLDMPTPRAWRPPTTAALRGMYAGLGVDNRPDWDTFKTQHRSGPMLPTPAPTTPAPTPPLTPPPGPPPLPTP